MTLYFTEVEAIERVKEIVDHYEVESIYDIEELATEDYYIIGTYKAKMALEEYGVFKALGEIKDYEEENFGEVYTDFSNPEAVANSLWAIVIREVLYEVIGIYDLEQWDDEESLYLISIKCDELLAND